MHWFLFDRDLCYERVKESLQNTLMNIRKLAISHPENQENQSQAIFICSKSTMETPEQYVKAIQS